MAEKGICLEQMDDLWKILEFHQMKRPKTEIECRRLGSTKSNFPRPDLKLLIVEALPHYLNFLHDKVM